MPAMTNIALREGWAVLAVNGPKVAVETDTILFGWGMLSSALEHLARTWPQTRQWPVACAGFSGGAKRSAEVAAAMTHDGWPIAGPGPGANVRDSMLSSGFTNVRMETYNGGHQLDPEQLRQALRWFKEKE